MPKAFVILNPAAGKGGGEEACGALSRQLARARIDYEIHETRSGETFGEIVRARLQGGFDLIVAVGGDGTVSAVIDGLAGQSAPLGIIPTGTANLLARELNIPLDADQAAALIARPPRSRSIDAMRIGGRTYVLIAGVGISASVAGGTTRRNKSRFGLIAYLGAAILKMFEFRSRHIDVAVDGTARRYHAVEVAVANCGILARMLFPAGPDIHVDDGHLGVWILSTKTLLDYPRYLLRLIAGRPVNPRAHFIKAERNISILSSSPLPIQADGDIIGTTPVDIEVLPGALRVLAPDEPATSPGLDLARDIFIRQYLPRLK
ncbi:MAG: diacylglycerol kinase family lipid kinase [Candidatus Krumholzibacteria bacterium]|nr:diacylglycerol kinase family lipid kinase [Candidatus Krumholzibacteria bacterium]